VYSPRVLPVYVYDAHADCGKNVRFVVSLLMLRAAYEIHGARCVNVFVARANFFLISLAVVPFLCFMALLWQQKDGALLLV